MKSRFAPRRPEPRVEARGILDWSDRDVKRLAELTGSLMETERLTRPAAALKAYYLVRRERKAGPT